MRSSVVCNWNRPALGGLSGVSALVGGFAPLVLAPLVLALACTGASGETESTTGPTTTETSPTDPTETGATTETDSTETNPTETNPTETNPTETNPTETNPTDPTDPTDTDPTDGPAVCGNSVIEPGEMCDDGNNDGGDGCEADCTLLAGEAWWEETIDGGDGELDRGYDVATDAAGNVYIVATLLDPFAKNDIFIRKYDPIGISIWSRNYDGGVNQNDQGVAIAGDDAGFMVVAGRQTLDANSGSVLWLSKCDPNGQILWQTTGAATENIASLAMFSATHFIAGGTVKEGMDTNALLRRYDDQAGELWTATHAGEAGGPDSIASVAVNNAGDIFVAGREFTDTTSFDAWVARYSAGGEEVWSVKVDGPESGADWGSAIAVSEDGWIAVGGRLDLGDAALGDAWLARYSVDGDEVWTQTIDGATSGDDGISGIALTSGGEIVAVGHEEVEGQGRDLWIRKLDADGGELWTRTIDGVGSGDDMAEAVAVDGDDNSVTVGTIAVIDKFDTDVLLVKHAP